MKKFLMLSSLSAIALMAAATTYAATPASPVDGPSSMSSSDTSSASMSSSNTPSNSTAGTGANGFFITGFGGTNYLQEQTYSTTASAGGVTYGQALSTTYDWGWNTGGAIGIKQNNLEYGFRVTYLDNGIDQSKATVNDNTISASSGSNTGWSYLGTVQYDFYMGPNNKWVPFINGGIGGATMDLKITGVSKSSTAFAYQIGGGVGYQVNDHLRIFGEYNHLGTTQLTGPDAASNGGNYYYQNNSFIGGLTYYIGNKA